MLVFFEPVKNIRMKRILAVLGALVVAVVMVLMFLFSYPEPAVDPQWMLESAEEIPAGALTVRYSGTSTLLFSDGDTSWMVDGWFTRPAPLTLLFGEVAPDMQAIDYGLARNEVESLAAVIPVHSHFDHAMDTPEVAKRTGAMVYGSEATANIARGWGLPEEQMTLFQNWSPVQLGEFVITPIESKHFQFPSAEMVETLLTDSAISQPLVPPVSAFDYKLGKAYVLHVRHPLGTFLVVGSAGFVPGQLEGVDVDAIFLGVGGLETQSPQYREEYWSEVVQATTPQRIFPIHWDSLTASIEKPFAAEVRITDLLLKNRDALLQYLKEKEAAHPEASFQTLPRFEEVVLFSPL